MLDIELIRSDPEYVRAALLKRTDDVDLDPILEADALRRKLTTEVDTARAERNRQAKEIGKLKASGADTAEAQKQAAALVEQHQQPDGTVAVPEPLRAWAGTDVLRPQC